MLSRLNLGIAMNVNHIWPNVINGFAGGFVFVPLTTMAMGRLRREEIGNASGIYNLMRNIGGSVGIATVTTLLVRRAADPPELPGRRTSPRMHRPWARLSPGWWHTSLRMGSIRRTAHRAALGALYQRVGQQASLMAYSDNFAVLGYLALFSVPLVMLFQRVGKQ